MRLYEKDKAIQEIIFWRNNLIRLNSCLLDLYYISTVFISLDASNQVLCEHKIEQSSSCRELVAIQFA